MERNKAKVSGLYFGYRVIGIQILALFLLWTFTVRITFAIHRTLITFFVVRSLHMPPYGLSNFFLYLTNAMLDVRYHDQRAEG